MKDDPLVNLFSIIVLIFFIGIGFVYYGQYSHSLVAFQDGVYAAKNKVSSESNPYKDYKGKAWLDGWIEENKKND